MKTPVVLLIALAAAGCSSGGQPGSTSTAASTTAVLYRSVTATRLPVKITKPPVKITKPRTTRPAAPLPETTARHTSAPAAAPPRPTTAAVPLRTTAVPTASCYPLSNAGNCYEPGELCRKSDHGVTGVAGDGETITCQYNNGWRWEPS